MATPFVIKRVDVTQKVGDCALIEVFDQVAAAANLRDPSVKEDWMPVTNEDGDLVYEHGWGPTNTENLLAASPRAFWLMARAGLVPVTENEALRTILGSGKRIERIRPPVANVQRVNIDDSTFFMRLRAHTRRKDSDKRVAVVDTAAAFIPGALNPPDVSAVTLQEEDSD